MLSKNKIKFIQSLRLKKGREAENLFIAEGSKLVTDLLNSNFKIHSVFATGDWLDSQKIPQPTGLETNFVSADELKKISSLSTPNQVLAIVHIPEFVFHLSELQNNLTLVLDDISDPGNLGTIIRIADWFGISQVLCSNDSVDVFNPKVVQATMGAIIRVKIHYLDLESFFRENAANAQLPVYGTFLEGDNVFETSLNHSGFIIMGNEAHGIAGHLQKYITQKLYIPNYPLGQATCESLNVSAATAIVCAEFRRRK